MDRVMIGLDVGKAVHHAAVVTGTGTAVFSRPVPQDETALRALFADAADHGLPVLVVDQCASIGALPRAVAHDLDIPVLYLSGSAFHHIARSFPGQTKTDRRDATIIATAGRTMPHAVRSLAPPTPSVAKMKVTNGHLETLTEDIRADKNRLRSLLAQVHAPLERLLGPRLGQAGVLPLLTVWPTPAALAAVSDADLQTFFKQHGSRRSAALVTEVRNALGQQTLVMLATDELGETIAYRAQRCWEALVEKRRVTTVLEAHLDASDTARLIGTMPGFGPTTIATFLIETDGKTFATEADLASYAGVAPTVRQSGGSRVVRRSRTANTRLKNAMCWAAFNATRSGPGKRFYAAKRHKGHWKAIIALARKRITVLYAMLRDETPYREPAPPPTLTQT